MDLLITIHLIFMITAVNGDCTLGRTDLEETTSNPTTGLYIDIDNPAVCSGQITAWNLCYYNPRPFIIQPSVSTVQISLQIWKLDEQQNGVRVGTWCKRGNSITIPQAPENFQCITIELSPEDYMNVSVGARDFIGVCTNLDAVLPVVGNIEGIVHCCFHPPVC